MSENRLTQLPDLSDYPNIKCITISRNNISGTITNHNFIEMSAEFNNLECIISNSIEKLVASNNKITNITIPNVKFLVINNNLLSKLDSYEKLDYCEVLNNKIETVKDLLKVKELYAANNNIVELGKFPIIKILTCSNNNLVKIPYYDSLDVIVSSITVISKKYKVETVTQSNNDYIIALQK